MLLAVRLGRRKEADGRSSACERRAQCWPGVSCDGSRAANEAGAALTLQASVSLSVKWE